MEVLVGACSNASQVKFRVAVTLDCTAPKQTSVRGNHMARQRTELTHKDVYTMARGDWRESFAKLASTKPTAPIRFSTHLEIFLVYASVKETGTEAPEMVQRPSHSPLK